MPSKVSGPFTLKWGDNTIEEVESVDTQYNKSSEDIETIQGNIRTFDGPHQARATITLLYSDIAALAALLPQHFVENGEVMSTGETVNNATGAIDINNGCGLSTVRNNFDIISCDEPADVTRLVNARTRYMGQSVSNKIRKVMIEVIAEPDAGEAAVQYFKENTISVVS